MIGSYTHRCSASIEASRPSSEQTALWSTPIIIIQIVVITNSINIVMEVVVVVVVVVVVSRYYWTVDNANQPRFAGKSYHLA